MRRASRSNRAFDARRKSAARPWVRRVEMIRQASAANRRCAVAARRSGSTPSRAAFQRRVGCPRCGARLAEFEVVPGPSRRCTTCPCARTPCSDGALPARACSSPPAAAPLRHLCRPLRAPLLRGRRPRNDDEGKAAQASPCSANQRKKRQQLAVSATAKRQAQRARRAQQHREQRVAGQLQFQGILAARVRQAVLLPCRAPAAVFSCPGTSRSSTACTASARGSAA